MVFGVIVVLVCWDNAQEGSVRAVCRGDGAAGGRNAGLPRIP